MSDSRLKSEENDTWQVASSRKSRREKKTMFSNDTKTAATLTPLINWQKSKDGHDHTNSLYRGLRVERAALTKKNSVPNNELAIDKHNGENKLKKAARSFIPITKDESSHVVKRQSAEPSLIDEWQMKKKKSSTADQLPVQSTATTKQRFSSSTNPSLNELLSNPVFLQSGVHNPWLSSRLPLKKDFIDQKCALVMLNRLRTDSAQHIQCEWRSSSSGNSSDNSDCNPDKGSSEKVEVDHNQTSSCKSNCQKNTIKSIDGEPGSRHVASESSSLDDKKKPTQCQDQQFVAVEDGDTFPVWIRANAQTQLYFTVSLITDLFTEQARVGARLVGRPSIQDYWKRNQNRIRQQAIDFYGVDSAMAIREILFKSKLETSNFNVMMGTFVYNLMLGCLLRDRDRGDSSSFSSPDCSTTMDTSKTDKGTFVVFDPFSGWGDRAICALACPLVSKYVGVDCNPNLVEGYAQLKQALDSSNKLQFVSSRFEQFDSIATTGLSEFDLILTSPPFYDYEVYSTVDQAYLSELKNYQNWLSSCMHVWLRKMYTLIKRNSYIVLYVENVSRAPTFCRDIYNFMIHSGELPGCQLIHVIKFCCGLGKDKFIRLWIYKKTKDTFLSLSTASSNRGGLAL